MAKRYGVFEFTIAEGQKLDDVDDHSHIPNRLPMRHCCSIRKPKLFSLEKFFSFLTILTICLQNRARIFEPPLYLDLPLDWCIGKDTKRGRRFRKMSLRDGERAQKLKDKAFKATSLLLSAHVDMKYLP
ncbi:MAG: hypothetical protein ACTS73_02425 [Arsenophonus sp. NEOnobi-MAG3]